MWCQAARKVERMNEILFRNDSHREFFLRHTENGSDVYFRALVYLLGLTAETRTNFSRCFDVKSRMIKPESLGEGWQTGSTGRIVRMAFNLWNGWHYEIADDADVDRVSASFTPDELFCCEFAPFFFEAIKLRYPEYTGSPW